MNEVNGWTPIEQFDFAKDAECRLVWMLAEDHTVIGECYYGEGPIYAHEFRMDEPRTKAWRYVQSDHRIPEHFKPTFFRQPLEPPMGHRELPGWPLDRPSPQRA
jgi:hypothetical protein